MPKKDETHVCMSSVDQPSCYFSAQIWTIWTNPEQNAVASSRIASVWPVAVFPNVCISPDTPSDPLNLPFPAGVDTTPVWSDWCSIPVTVHYWWDLMHLKTPLGWWAHWWGHHSVCVQWGQPQPPTHPPTNPFEVLQLHNILIYF